jgi:hypothetical protein
MFSVLLQLQHNLDHRTVGYCRSRLGGEGMTVDMSFAIAGRETEVCQTVDQTDPRLDLRSPGSTLCSSEAIAKAIAKP